MDAAFSKTYRHSYSGTFPASNPGWAPEAGTGLAWWAETMLLRQHWLACLSTLFSRGYPEILLVASHDNILAWANSSLVLQYLYWHMHHIFKVLNFPKFSGDKITMPLAFVKYSCWFQSTSTSIVSYVFFHTSNSLVNPTQPGLHPPHSTKAALVKVNDNFHVKSPDHFSGLILLNCLATLDISWARLPP